MSRSAVRRSSWVLGLARKNLLRYFAYPSPNFLPSFKKCEIWPRFSTAVALKRSGVEMVQYVGNVKDAFGAKMIVLYPLQIFRLSLP